MRINAPDIMMTADGTPAGGGPSVGSMGMGKKASEKEVIHSGHFMVSDFEAEAQDDEENVLLEIPGDNNGGTSGGQGGESVSQGGDPGVITYAKRSGTSRFGGSETISIDSSLTKLFNAMSIAYRQKITSPKWNRFKGLKLRWKDKIRLNNVIWRCWHMQFILRRRMTVCQFALDVDMHNKPEAIVLEGKYWKRQLEAVTAEYKKWRIYYKNKISGSSVADTDYSIFDLEGLDFSKPPGLQMSMDDGDFSEFMDFTDVLFSSLVSPPQAFAFPNPREIARGTENSDFIQPGLIQLQPNLDDFMDIVEPLQEMLAGRGLPPVPEEELLPDVGHTPELPPPSTDGASPSNQQQQQQHSPVSALQYTARLTANPFLETVPTPAYNRNTTIPNNNNNNNTTSITSSSSPHVPISISPLSLEHQQQHPHQHPHQEPQQPHPHSHPSHTSVYRPTQMPPLEQHSQQPQLVSLPTQSPPSSYRQQSNLVLLRDTSSTNIHTQQPPIQLQSQNPASPLQQPLTPPQLQQPLTPPNLHHQPHTPPQQQLKQGPPSPQLQQQHHTSPRAFVRSQSHHELITQHQQQQQQQQQASSNNKNDPFVIPKSYPRRRSHSSGGSNTSGHVGTTSVAPQQMGTSPTSLGQLSPSANTVIATSLPHLAPAPPVGAIATGSTAIISSPVITPVQASTTHGGSALLAQLLTSGSCPVNCSSQSPSGHHLATLSTSGQLASFNNSMTVNSCNNVKVSLMIPGVIAGSSASSKNSSSSISTFCNLSSNSSDIKPCNSPSVLVAPVTLNAVTPPGLKPQTFTQVSPWSSCSPKDMLIKKSPPHPEPTSPLMVPSPPNKAFRPKSDTERVHYKEHRRVCHINAEQKRRSNLKSNFDILHQLIPFISQSPNAKISKAALLQKGAEYIRQLKSERQSLAEEAERLRADIEKLGSDISNAQAQLPATGAPMTHANHSKLKEMFNNYVRDCTLGNWKFWIFSLITEPLLESYNNSVSTCSLDDLCRSSLAWLDQQCSLNALRPLASNSMRKLSTTTNVLADPSSLPEEVYRGVTKQEGDVYCAHW